MRATFIAGGGMIDTNETVAGHAHDRPGADRSRTSWTFRSRSTRKASYGLTSCAAAAWDLAQREVGDAHAAAAAVLLPIIGLTDFHGQLDPDTYTMDGKNVPVGGAAQLATMFDEEAANFPGQSLLLASGDNVGASPANSGLLEDMPTIDVENAWGLDATSYGNHEFDYGDRAAAARSRRAPTSPSWAPTSSTKRPA